MNKKLSFLLSKFENDFYYIQNQESIQNSFDLVLDEIKGYFNAKEIILFLLNKNETLFPVKSILSQDKNILTEIANATFEHQSSFFAQKGECVLNFTTPILEPTISCFLGEKQENKNYPIGVLIVSGISIGNLFSLNDFHLVDLFSDHFSRILLKSFLDEESHSTYTSLNLGVLLLLSKSKFMIQNSKFENLLKDIIQISSLINSSLEISLLLEAIMNSAKNIFQTESCSLMLIDDKKEFLFFHSVLGEKSDEISKIKIPLGQGVAGTVAVSRKPMILNDAPENPLIFKKVDFESEFTTRNILAAPLLVDGEVIGVLEAINSVDKSDFTDNDLKLFVSFSEVSALAIQKTRLIGNLENANKELGKKVNELEGLFELGQAISSSLDQNTLLKSALKIISKELDVKTASVLILNPLKKTVNSISFKNQKYDIKVFDISTNSFLLNCIKLDKIIFTPGSYEDIHLENFDLKFIQNSFIFLPLKSSQMAPFGGIVISEKIDSEFTHNDLKFLQTMISQLSKAYENIRYQDEAIIQKEVQKEIEITKKIQNNILPSNINPHSNFEIGVKSKAAKEVSGDFYDYYDYSNGNFGFLIADVSGKSLPAAIFMAISSSIIRTLAITDLLSPEKILNKGNSIIYEDSHSGMFVTCFFIEYNPTTFEIQFASAGHNDQVWIKADGSYELIKGKGAPLGVIPNSKFVGGKFQVSPSDLLVLYTDGVVEEKDKDDNEFGIEKMIEEIIKRKEKHPQMIIEEIYDLTREFAESDEQFDDFTLMILKFNNEFQYKRKYNANGSEIPKFLNFIENILNYHTINEMLKTDIVLACDEAATNIIMHAYKNTKIKNPQFECNLKIQNNQFELQLIDQGPKFEREKIPDPNVDENLSGKRKGGFGVYIYEKLMDEIRYEFLDDKNHLTLVKKIT